MQTLTDIKWPIARYRFDFVATKSIHLPAYAGSALRGTFGHSLRSIACMTRQKDCKACPLYQDCAYTNIFEAPAPKSHKLQKFSQIPNAYVFEPPSWGKQHYEPGEILSFHMVLVGHAIARLALIIYALSKAFERDVAHGTAKLLEVRVETPNGEDLIYSDQDPVIADHDPRLTLSLLPPKKEVRLQFHTPLRLQNNGKILSSEELSAATILMALVRRISLIAEFHCSLNLDADFGLLRTKAETTNLAQQMRWQIFTRFSSRQKTLLNYNGLVGECILYDLDPVFLPFLQLGTWLHLGKGATFGLGKYVIA